MHFVSYSPLIEMYQLLHRVNYLIHEFRIVFNHYRSISQNDIQLYVGLQLNGIVMSVYAAQNRDDTRYSCVDPENSEPGGATI